MCTISSLEVCGLSLEPEYHINYDHIFRKQLMTSSMSHMFIVDIWCHFDTLLAIRKISVHIQHLDHIKYSIVQQADFFEISLKIQMNHAIIFRRPQNMY
jgi:hypothetical protein